MVFVSSVTSILRNFVSMTFGFTIVNIIYVVYFSDCWD